MFSETLFNFMFTGLMSFGNPPEKAFLARFLRCLLALLQGLAYNELLMHVLQNSCNKCISRKFLPKLDFGQDSCKFLAKEFLHGRTLQEIF